MKYQRITRCDLCHTSTNQARVLFSLNSEQRLLQCCSCKLVFNDLCRIDFESIYDDNYYTASEKSSPGGYFSYDRMDEASIKTNRFATQFLSRRYMRPNKPFSLLDVGCGFGYFLSQFTEHPGVRLAGVEVSPTAARHAQTVTPDITQQPFEEALFDRQFDVITAFEVIEHLLYPSCFLQKIHSMLFKNGYAILTTPDVGSLWFTTLKRRWPGIHPHCHNVYFSCKTIKQYAKQAGFQVLSIRSKQYHYMPVYHVRKRLLELFPRFAKILKNFQPWDQHVIPFLNGGDLEVILQKTA